MEIEPNNIISKAIDIQISSREQTTTVSGRIDLLSDVDFYRFELASGMGITIDFDLLNADSNRAGFDSYLQIFDENGELLAFNDDFSLDSEAFSLDSYLGFIANQTGNYYVGVSSVVNSDYNPVTGTTSGLVQDNFVTGDYNLNFNTVEVIADEDPNNTLVEAVAVGLDESRSITIDDAIALESDVDVFAIELAAGEGFKLKVNAKKIDSELDSYLRIFDGAGNELVFDDNSANNPIANPADITTDSSIDFAPQTPGAYFIGVSSAGNFDYDVINGDTNLNLSPNTGFSTGEYQLQVDILDVIPDEDPDNTIAETIDSGITSGGERSGTVSGEIAPELDVDLYKINLDAGDGVYLDLDAKTLDSQLDSYLRIFDGAGNELTFDNNDDANLLGDFSTDSAIAFAPVTPGEYYIGVSDAGNVDYDPVNGRNNFSSNLTSPFSTSGSYQLNINLAAIVPDEDLDNTLGEAIDTNVSSLGTRSTVLIESIDSVSDVDLYGFQLDAGEGVSLNIDAATQGSDLDSYLRLFDSQGNQLAFDDDDDNNMALDDTTADSLLNFVADISGEYYIGVSSEGNSTYNAIDGSSNFSNTTGFSTGDYQLAIDISTVISDSDLDNTIAEAVATGVSLAGTRSTTINDTISPGADVDLYQFQMETGSTITLDLDAATNGSDLDSVLRLFNSAGDEIVNNDDATARDETSSTDSWIEFTAEVSGTYYVGVSSFPNFGYDPINGSTNFSNDLGTSSGDYSLTISLAENI